MTKRYSKVKQTLVILGLVGTIFTGALGLTGCTSSEYKQAQENIDVAVTETLNSAEIQAKEKGLFSNYTFLAADVKQENDSQYLVGINGIAERAETNKKEYTTINYLVSNSYFENEENTKNDVAIINTLAEIVKNENYQDYSIANVNDLDGLNNAMGDVTESPIDGFRENSNFLYGVGNVQFSEEDNVVSFTTKELTKFSRTRNEITYGIVSYIDGKPQYGTVIKPVTDYESFFIDNTVYIKLTPEEMERAKVDESIVFDKFIEYVKNQQKDKYVIQQTNVADEKAFNANMKNFISFGALEK